MDTSKVLIVVDMQGDFVTGSMGSESAQAIIGNIKLRIEETLGVGGRVLFTMDTHKPSDYEGSGPVEAQKIPPHCLRETEGWRIIPELAGYASDQNVIEKPDFLSLTLGDAIGPGRPEIELCGVCTDICVVSNALYLRAKYPYSRISVREDCCAGTSQQAHQSALDVMSSCLVVIAGK